MNNRFKKKLTGDEVEGEVRPEHVEKAGLPGNFFTQFFSDGFMSKEAATNLLPFIVYVAFLGMIYIANRHYAENNIRDIDQLSREVKELSWDFKTLKADLMLKSTQTEVAKLVDTMGPVAPPKKIIIQKGEFE
jgi:hypothetical protein